MSSVCLEVDIRSVVRRFAVAAVLVLAAILLLQSPSYAQINGTISGTVYDKTGAVIPNANVTMVNQATADTRDTVTNGDGYFAFASVPPGTYSIKAELKGFKTSEQKDVVLQASDKRKVDLTLEVGQTAETVTVEAHTELTPVDSGARSLDLTAADYSRLPMITRNAAELLRTLPGVITVGNGVTNGASSSMDFSGVGAAGSSVGNGVSAGGVPYRGGTALLMDGTNILDEGCDCTSISVPNPDFVQEVKVQTSAFTADSAKGPIVIDFLTKSGAAQYHGEGYLYARNNVLNSNSWLLNHQGTKKPGGDHYYYPGGNFGGPVPLMKKKLLFWVGYEHFYQLSSGGTDLTSYIPTSDMLNGNFSGTSANDALCQADLGLNAQSTDPKAVGTWCANTATYTIPATGTTPAVTYNLGPGGQIITPAMVSALPVDPGAAAMWKLMPPANADPATSSSHYNYFYAVPALHNGYVFRARGDYNITDKDKLFVTYQFSKDNEPGDGDSHMWWLPGNSVVFPGGGLMNPTTTKNVTGSFLHMFSPTLTNEMTAFWTYYWSPQSPGAFNKVLRGTVGYPSNYGTTFTKTLPLAETMVPGWNSAGSYTFPDFSQWDVFSGTGGSYFIKKENPAFSDNLTKVWMNHTIKAGFYYETTGNNQGNFNPVNGGFSFGSSQAYPDAVTGLLQGTQNPTANFMMGIASNYNETNYLPLNDQAYRTIAMYVTDSWKAHRRLTVDIGARLEHLGHWYDRGGFGNAVWLPGRIVPDVLSGKQYPGVYWHKIDPGLPVGGSPSRILFTEPRVGVAYDVFGTGRTVVRGGWGAYRFNDQVNDYGAVAVAEQMVNTSLPSNTTVLFSEPGLLPKPAIGFTPGGTIGALVDPNDYEVPFTDTWNFTIDQRTPWNTHFEIAYEGNNAGSLFFGGQVGGGGNLGGYDLSNVNKTPLGAYFQPDPWTGVTATNPENPCGTISCVNGLADYHPYGTMSIGGKDVNVYGTNGIQVNEHKGYSNYNALAAIWSKQTGRLTFNTSFLWSKALGFGFNSGGDPFCLRCGYVVLNIDRPFVWNSSYAYDLKRVYHGDSKVASAAANGWIISGFTTFQSGANMQAQSSQNFGMGFTYSDGSTLTQRSFFGTDAGLNVQPIETCNPTNGLASKQFATLSCFAPPSVPTGTSVAANGPFQLPYIPTPVYFDSDLALIKTFHITERHQVEFRASAQNFLNHALLSFSSNSPLTLKYSLNKATGTYAYVGSVAASAWGFADQKQEPLVNGNGRIIQLSLKYSF